ncbi:MAG: ribbon-helix-helix domain-containing protein [Candidatus Saccharimonadales bacterium]
MNTTQTFNVSFPVKLLEMVDKQAAAQFGSRSDFLRAAALHYIKQEAEWEYLFSEGKKIGSQSQFGSEEGAVAELGRQRRTSGRWTVKKAA